MHVCFDYCLYLLTISNTSLLVFCFFFFSCAQTPGSVLQAAATTSTNKVWPCQISVGPPSQGPKGITTKQRTSNCKLLRGSGPLEGRKPRHGSQGLKNWEGKADRQARTWGKTASRGHRGGGKARGQEGGKEPQIAEEATIAQAPDDPTLLGRHATNRNMN